jgi:hypothetical protein
MSKVAGQLLDNEPGQPNGAPAGPGLGRPDMQDALDLNDDIGHRDRAAEQVHSASAQAGQLADAQASVGAD